MAKRDPHKHYRIKGCPEEASCPLYNGGVERSAAQIEQAMHELLLKLPQSRNRHSAAPAIFAAGRRLTPQRNIVGAEIARRLMTRCSP